MAVAVTGFLMTKKPSLRAPRFWFLWGAAIQEKPKVLFLTRLGFWIAALAKAARSQ
jgi:hypothetical protein